MVCRAAVAGVLWGLAAAGGAAGVAPTAQELADARAWSAGALEGAGGGEPPFSFTCGGQFSKELLASWPVERSSRRLDARRTAHTAVWKDPRTRLVVRLAAVAYDDFPTVEWTVFLRNAGPADAPILEDVRSLDLRVERSGAEEFVLHHQTGSPCTPADYEPHATVLGPKAAKRISAAGGRPTNSDLPYFNVALGGGGRIVVVGWPGQWSATFERDAARGLRIRAGQERTHFVLHPGEEVRTPLSVVQFYRGDRFGAQNVWRRWMVAYNLPRPGGRCVPTHFAACSGNLQPRADEEIGIIEGFLREGVRLDHWILDAGWYPGGGRWENTGTWEPDASRFPGGLRAVGDRVHAAGMKFVVWFEPERVTPGTWLYERHPEWLLGPAGRQKLLHLGHAAARAWLVGHIDRLLGEQGIDVYRQDFNIDPLEYWRAADAPDRQGLTEIAYVTGYLSWWDELLRRRPGLWIDSCASGGRRNDLETLRRAVPLLRSDYFQTAEAQQSQTWGIALWMPYFGSGHGQSDAYWFRSCVFPATRVGWDARRRDLDYGLLRRMVAEYRRVEPCLLGDFWPLMPYSLAPDAWMAWQFDRPETGEGFVQVFRRPACPSASARFALRGLEASATYELVDQDTGRPTTLPGRELLERGLAVELPSRPAAGLWTYRKVR